MCEGSFKGRFRDRCATLVSSIVGVDLAVADGGYRRFNVLDGFTYYVLYTACRLYIYIYIII